jgi:hypothetical protein
MYDIHVHLDSFNIIINDVLEYITITFNTNKWKAIYILYVCIVHIHVQILHSNNFQTINQQSPKHCPIIIMEDFNVDILKYYNQPKKKKKLLYFMDNFQLESQFNENTTKVGSQSNHI